MAKKESPRFQELGPKKYYSELEKQNKFYDKYKAGKKDPKTGEFYHKIDFENPGKSKLGHSKFIADFKCLNCDTYLTVRRNTAGIICPSCKKFHSVTVNRITEEVLVDGKELNDE